ncbi:hypothetical protein [Streptomyces sp. NPDC001292]|uniref:hypothetical protein n=1 Tax=Streptomyces sp. NPDC001292 TaxID=3364558 RepID=UPI0036A68946
MRYAALPTWCEGGAAGRLLPAAERLGELLGAPVAFAQDTVGPAAHDAATTRGVS